MRKDVPMGADASDFYSKRWRRWLGWASKTKHAVKRQYHKQERAAGRAQTSSRKEHE